jgi:hypothetical protein
MAISTKKAKIGNEKVIAIEGLDNTNLETVKFLKKQYGAIFSEVDNAYLVENAVMDKKNKSKLKNETALYYKVLNHAAITSKLTEVISYKANSAGKDDAINKYKRQQAFLELCQNQIEGFSINLNQYGQYIEKMQLDTNIKMDQKIREKDKFERITDAVNELESIGFLTKSQQGDNLFLDTAHLKMLSTKYFLDTAGLVSCHEAILRGKDGANAMDKLEKLDNNEPIKKENTTATLRAEAALAALDKDDDSVVNDNRV